MDRVFLVDDEYLAIEGLRLLVDWNSLGAEVCGVAYDGESALEQILTQKPDVVLTDIRMPGMNGLDLIAAVKQALPSTLFAVISGYNEFEYARSALRLGVIDYIDKPVTVEKIEAVYRKIRSVLESRRRFAAGQESRRPQFSLAIEDLLHFPQHITEALPRVSEKYQVDFSGMQEFLLSLCRPAGLEAEESLRRLWQDSGRAEQADLEIYPKDGLLLLLFLFPGGMPGRFREWLHSFLERLISDGALSAAGIGELRSGIAELEDALRDGEQALRYAEYFDEPVVTAEELSYQLTPPAQMLHGANEIVFHFRVGAYEQALEKVDELLNLLLESGLALELFCSECLKLIHIGLGLCRETGREFDRNGAPFLPHVEIRQYHRAVDIADWVFSVYQGMVLWMQEQRKKSDHKVTLAKDYIDQHYSETITLPYLASLCGMQPTYFSMLFKEQVGQTYIKYLNLVRMEHAKRLLAEGVKVKDIYRQVGFQSYRYFCDKFKSLLGLTPEQYRSRLR